MPVNSVSLCNFRNFKHAEAEFSDGINIIKGNNAQGKTNLIEAVFYLSALRSFRGARDEQLINNACDSAVISERLFNGTRSFVLDARLFTNSRRQLFVNQVQLKKAAEIVGIMPAVVFTPDDLSVIKDSSAVRRKMIDFPLCQMRPRYLEELTAYNRVLKMKRALIKEEASADKYSLCDTYNVSMSRHGAAVLCIRNAYIKTLSEEASSVYSEISAGKDSLKISYKTVSAAKPEEGEKKNAELIYERLSSLMKPEFASGTCLSGIHRDDVMIDIDNIQAKGYASQGQMRSAALSIKLAEREILKKEFGYYPLLMMDDILSELDAQRQDYVLNRIKNGQIFITCCDDSPFMKLEKGRLIHIEKGSVIKTEEI